MRVSARHFLTTMLCTTVAVAALSFALLPSKAHAQENLLGPLGARSDGAGGQGSSNMVLKAREMQYDQDNEVVTAIGTVQIYYNGRALQADRVVYDRKAKRVRANGNVVITEADGTKTYADNFDLTDDFRDGFVNSLKMVTADELYIASNRAERTSGRSSSPVMPGMLMSENIRIRLAPFEVAICSRASAADCAKIIAKRPARSSRRNCWRNRSVTSGSSSTTRMRTLMDRSPAGRPRYRHGAVRS